MMIVAKNFFMVVPFLYLPVYDKLKAAVSATSGRSPPKSMSPRKKNFPVHFPRLPRGKPLVIMMMKRLALFALFMCLLTLFLYVIGTRQGFMDLTQLSLLRLASGLGIFLAALSLYGTVFEALMVFRRRQYRFLWGLGGYLLTGIFGAGITAFSSFISAAARGNLQ
jgi:hypothetical protein